MGRSKVSGPSTLVISEICATSSLAATRGRMFLPSAVAGARMWLYEPASASTCSAMFSARPSAKYAASATMTFETPAICAAAAAAPLALEPATSTCTSPPHWAAAMTVWRVLPFRLALSCSAITNATMIFPCTLMMNGPGRLDDFGFVAQLGNQRRHVGHLDDGRALGRL